MADQGQLSKDFFIKTSFEVCSTSAASGRAKMYISLEKTPLTYRKWVDKCRLAKSSTGGLV